MNIQSLVHLLTRIHLTMFIFIFLTACGDDRDTHRPMPNVPPAEVEIVRIDQILCDTTSPFSVDQMMETYPVFSDVYFHQIIYPQNTPSIGLDLLVNNFCAAPAIRHLRDTTRIQFPELSHLEDDLGRALGYFQYYFPDLPVPEVFAYISEFGIGTFTVDTRVLGIGLDFFLGSQYPYYDPAVFPNYMVRTMTPEYMAGTAIQALAQVLLSPPTTGNMLDHMIYNGKTIYIASRLLPWFPMHRICLYSLEEMDWVESNELHIWSYFLDLDYFYENDPRKYRKFVDPGPTTPGMPEQAPGRVANWIGYRIVEEYMDRHPEISLSQLATDTDFQKIMDQSRYKPRRPR